VTSETFEAEFVAYNEFRRACMLTVLTRDQFAATVARHNATIARKSVADEAAWRALEEEAARFDIDKQEPDENLPA
jgi:hypothetical protein